jgi:hypothetical protein
MTQETVYGNNITLDLGTANLRITIICNRGACV